MCPTTNRKHLHFFISFKAKQSFSVVAKALNCHIEQAFGTWDKCLAYCCKGDSEPMSMLESK